MTFRRDLGRLTDDEFNFCRHNKLHEWLHHRSGGTIASELAEFDLVRCAWPNPTRRSMDKEKGTLVWVKASMGENVSKKVFNLCRPCYDFANRCGWVVPLSADSTEE